MKLLSFYIVTFFLLLSTSCKNEINIQVPGVVPQEGQVGGKIILPEGNKLDTIGLEVLSALKATIPVNSTYAVDTAGKTSTTLLMNKAGDVVLMGYNYPGQTDSNLSAESTALALLMNTLTMRSVSPKVKQEIIMKAKANPGYAKLVSEISNALKSGKAVSDTTNTKLIEAIAVLFKGAANLKVTEAQDYDMPVIVEAVNTELQIRNNKVAHSYIAGIYKENILQRTFTIGGYRAYATGVEDAIATVFGDGYGIPDEVKYTMAEDGDYKIKIRSGKPGADDGSEEHKKARTENIAKFVYGQLLDNFPFPDDCATAVLVAVKNRISNIMGAQEALLSRTTSAADFTILAMQITSDVFSDTKAILKGCDDISEGTFTFFKGMGKVIKVVKMLNIGGQIMQAANISRHAINLFQAKSAIDTCFQVVGLRTFKCGEKPTYFVKVFSGSGQKGKSGEQLTEPLKVKVTYDDGKPANKTTVNWAVKSGNGKVSAASSLTNYEGVAEINWIIGSGDQQLEAYVNKKVESTAASFTAASTNVAAGNVEIISKNIQGGFTNPFKVKITDSNGKPISKAEVDWQVKSGLDITTFDKFTNDQGIAEASVIITGIGTFSMNVVLKSDPSKFAIFTARPIITGSGSGTIYIDPAIVEGILPDPFKAFFVDKYFLPVSGPIVQILALDNDKDHRELVADQLGLMVIKRNVEVTQYRINIIDPISKKIITAFPNITIK